MRLKANFLFVKSKLNDEDAVENREKWVRFVDEKFG